MPPATITLHSNRALPAGATGGQTSTVGEPSVANNDAQILVTANWYAARSTDRGATWTHLSPFNLLPPADAGFCCDQTALYVPSHDITVWLLQYAQNSKGNTLRVAVKRGKTLGDDRWHWWDFRPERTNADWAGEWFDYNHAAVGKSFLYVGSNVFSLKGDQFRRSVILRLPLKVLAEGGQLNYRYFQTTKNFSLRLTQGAGGTMYFGSHQDLRTVRLFSWPENGNVTQTDIAVTPWNAGSYTAPGPDGRNWLGRADPRITGAWVARGVIGFMWTANAKGSARPRPHVRVVRINESTKRLIDQPDIWHASTAYAYADASPNSAGDVGITLFRGGGTLHPGHVVGGWDEANRRWVLQATRDGTHGPGDGKWGDYLTCRPHSPDLRTWLAVGYALRNGSGRQHIEQRLVRFGLNPGTATA